MLFGNDGLMANPGKSLLFLNNNKKNSNLMITATITNRFPHWLYGNNLQSTSFSTLRLLKFAFKVCREKWCVKLPRLWMCNKTNSFVVYVLGPVPNLNPACSITLQCASSSSVSLLKSSFTSVSADISGLTPHIYFAFLMHTPLFTFLTGRSTLEQQI